MVGRTGPERFGRGRSRRDGVRRSDAGCRDAWAFAHAHTGAHAAPTPTPAPTATAQPTPSPTPDPASLSCAPGQLAARITLWEGAAGHRIAHVELTNAGSGACTIRAMSKPQLVDGNGSVLIDGVDPSASKLLVVAAGDVLKTLVQDANYCGPDPVAPVSVAFVLSSGGRIVATPVSPTDVTVPPCNGAPGSAGDIEMQPWAP